MDIIQTQDEKAVILELTGRLDTVTSPKFQDVLLEAISLSLDIVLDFTGVDYISSAGLRVLLLGQKNIQADGRSMTLKNVSSDVMEIFNVTGFSGMLTIL